MARFGQLGIQKRNLFDSTSNINRFKWRFKVLTYCCCFVIFPIDLGGHAISMGVFGYAGYWAYRWDQRAAVLLAEKRAELAARRRPQEVEES